ncbi:MAG TPA: endonuclease/exonuclease/phosphatase family protein [Pirellulales bacterium]|nr:endonuclease/exonuclease/phosphatase family protein [Pirellulales bacterium]
MEVRDASLKRTSSRALAFKKHLSRTAYGCSLLLCLAIAICYAWRLDAWAAVTVFPVWVWVLAGLILVAAARRQFTRRWLIGGILAWCVLLLVFSDHPRSLLRFSADERGEGIRLVSLNCAGSSEALCELAALRPDIVLVQESPGREPLVSFARDLFGDEGEVLSGVDASIIAHGKIIRLPVPEDITTNAVHARIRLRQGSEIEVISLRLEAPVVRVDLWSPDCWRAQTANRQRRRKQLQRIITALGNSSAGLPIIIGGDFNAPPGDAVFDSLQSSLHDAFGEAGRGWGNTAINTAPFSRIDQIWLSPQLRATDVYSSKTRHSDHRMVVCDVCY